jgi:hypothetical protein
MGTLVRWLIPIREAVRRSQHDALLISRATRWACARICSNSRPIPFMRLATRRALPVCFRGPSHPHLRCNRHSQIAASLSQILTRPDVIDNSGEAQTTQFLDHSDSFSRAAGCSAFRRRHRDGGLEVRRRGSSKTAFFTLRRHAIERHHAAPSSESRWTTAERTMTPAEASLRLARECPYHDRIVRFVS